MTTVRPTSPTATVLSVGGQWLLGMVTQDADRFLTADETPVVTLTSPAGVITSPGVDMDEVAGYWTCPVMVDSPGRWVVHVATLADAYDAAAYALGPTTASGMPTVSDCVHYAKDAYRGWGTDQVQDALSAEAQAQRDVCGERNPYPDSLRQALLRRVLRNLAMRALPLAIATGDAESGPTVLPGRDPEVRRFEAPYRRRPVG
jgi:hypothetical protein